MDCVYSFALAWMVADPQLGGVGDRPLLRYRRRHAIHFVDAKVGEGPEELKNKELFSCLGRHSSSCPSSFSTLKSMMALTAAARQSTSTVLVWSRIRRDQLLTGHWRRCAVHLIFTRAMRLHLRTDAHAQILQVQRGKAAWLWICPVQ